MKPQISDLTHKILAFTELQSVDTNESIDWANEMIALGFESPSLFMLASCQKPTNYAEIIDYVTDAVEELGLAMKTGEDATLSYAHYYIHKMAQGQNTRAHLSALYQFCQMHDCENSVYDFYLLYWAWKDIDFEDSAYNHYWAGARKANIEKIVIEVAKCWIEKNG